MTSLFPDLTWFEWTGLYSKLSQFCIVKEQAGVVVPHNSEVRNSICFSRTGVIHVSLGSHSRIELQCTDRKPK